MIKCERTGCPDHDANEHLDPRHERYDGPGITFGALPESCRRAAYALRDAGAPVPEIVDMAREILRLREQVAAVRVDADRQVRAALQQSQDCEAHGREIAELGKQLQHASERAERNDRGRIALLSLLHSLRELRAVPTLDALQRAARKASDAHDRAWKS